MSNVTDKNKLALAKYYVACGYQVLHEVMPSMPGLADYLEMTPDDLVAWLLRDDPYLLPRVMNKQHLAMLNEGLRGNMNPTIVKLILGKHGYSEKAEVVNTGTTTVVHREITPDMDPKEASIIYEEMISTVH